MCTEEERRLRILSENLQVKIEFFKKKALSGNNDQLEDHQQRELELRSKYSAKITEFKIKLEKLQILVNYYKQQLQNETFKISDDLNHIKSAVINNLRDLSTSLNKNQRERTPLRTIAPRPNSQNLKLSSLESTNFDTKNSRQSRKNPEISSNNDSVLTYAYPKQTMDYENRPR